MKIRNAFANAHQDKTLPDYRRHFGPILFYENLERQKAEADHGYWTAKTEFGLNNRIGDELLWSDIKGLLT